MLAIVVCRLLGRSAYVAWLVQCTHPCKRHYAFEACVIIVCVLFCFVVEWNSIIGMAHKGSALFIALFFIDSWLLQINLFHIQIYIYFMLFRHFSRTNCLLSRSFARTVSLSLSSSINLAFWADCTNKTKNMMGLIVCLICAFLVEVVCNRNVLAKSIFAIFRGIKMNWEWIGWE